MDLRVSAPAGGSSTGLISLATGPLPPGVTATFSAPALVPNGSAVLTLTTSGATPLGSSVIPVTGTASIDGRTVTRTASTTLDVQAPGQTVLQGQVRDEQDLPLAGVRISLGGTPLTPLGTTDTGGNFLIPLAVTGPQIFLIDGSALNTSTTFYPTVPVTVDIQPGVVNGLGFVARLTAIPAAKLTPISPGQETILTAPDLPGFSVTIPAGVQIIGWDGQPNTQVGVTAVPIERSPLPPPPAGLSGGPVYLFSFGKVGGGLPTGNVVVDLPNDLGAEPGETIDLYFFNEAPDGTAPNQWEPYGTATVSQDGTRIITDLNPATGQPYGVPRFCCGAVWPVRVSFADQVRSRHAQGGEPVDLVTGRFTVRKTDLVLPGRLPLTLDRFYRTDPPQGVLGGVLGPGWSLASLDHRLVAGLALILGDQSAYPFTETAPGRWENRTEPFLRGVVITELAPLTYELRFKDGTVQRYERLAGTVNVAALAAIIDRTGNTLTITREPQVVGGFFTGRSRIARITEPAGGSFTFSYDAQSRLSAVTDPLFRQVRYTYDAQGRLETVTDPAGGVTRYTYDQSNRILTIADPRGITFLQNEYDANGRVIRQSQADGGAWHFRYQLVGSRVVATTVTDPRGHPSTYQFTGQGFTVSQTDALGQTTTFEYEPGSNLLRSTTDPLGRTTRFTYDTNGNVITIIDPAGDTRTFTYEGTFNRVASITDPLGQATRFEYDAAGNLTAMTDPLGARTAIAYNSVGQPTSTTDPLGDTTTFGYDSVGNLATITDPLGNATTRTYDAVSRLIFQTDPRGYSTGFAYDALNRLTQLTDALNGVTSFSYDGNGNLLTVTDARGSVISHSYDPMDRLASRTDPVGAVEFFQYDGGGNLTQHTDRKGQVATFAYDPLNRRTGAAYADGSTTSFSYDAAGRLVQAADSVGGTILNAYDTLDRLVSQATGLGTIAYQYDALGRRTRMDAPGQAPVFYGYDAASRLRTITQAPLSPVTINYDALGRRTLLTLPNGVSTEYQYDTASRLTALIYRNALGPLGDLTYQYDAAGNRTRVGGSFARTLLPDPVPSATYDPANRQLQFSDRQMTFDANGQVTSSSDAGAVTSFVWSARGRLMSLSSPSVSASFEYDTFGRRIATTFGPATTHYLYDGPNIGQDLRESNSVFTLHHPTNLDEPLVRQGEEYYLADGLGSIVALADSSGSIVSHYSYDPFGRTLSEGQTSQNTLQYTGRENDGTFFYYFRARYYSPQTMRFLAEDPIGPLGGINRYAYAANNPLRFIDPSGLIPGVPEIPDGLDGVSPAFIAVVYAEATRQNYSAKVAVANVVKNRVMDRVYEFRHLRTYERVIFQRNAFEAIQTERFALAQQVLSGRKPRRLTAAERQRLADAFRAAQGVYHNMIPDHCCPN